MAKILIVEDDLDLVETYTDLLETQGHSILSASRIAEAQLSIAEMQPELIVLDLNLPGSSEAAISAFIHTLRVEGQSKIIVISGHAEMMSGQEWFDDVDLVLTKPVDNQHLIMMIDRFLFL